MLNMPKSASTYNCTPTLAKLWLHRCCCSRSIACVWRGANIELITMTVVLGGTVQQQPGCKCIFLQCSPIHLLAVHQWSNKNLVAMCAKVMSISYTCWATYSNRKTTPGQEVYKFYLFQALLLAYWGVKNTRLKWQSLFAPCLGGPTVECYQL